MGHLSLYYQNKKKKSVFLNIVGFETPNYICIAIYKGYWTLADFQSTNGSYIWRTFNWANY